MKETKWLHDDETKECGDGFHLAGCEHVKNPSPIQTTETRFRERFGTNSVDLYGNYSDVSFGEKDLLSFIEEEKELARKEGYIDGSTREAGMIESMVAQAKREERDLIKEKLCQNCKKLV